MAFKTLLWSPDPCPARIDCSLARRPLEIYDPSDIAGLLGEDIVILTIVIKDGKQLEIEQFNTGPDDLWTATKNGTIVSANHGTIWQENPHSSTNLWNSW